MPLSHLPPTPKPSPQTSNNGDIISSNPISHYLNPINSPITFPSDCVSSIYDFKTNGLGLLWTYGTQGYALSTCCPSGNYYTQGFAWLMSYYSSGVCPAAYKTCGLPIDYTDQSTLSGDLLLYVVPV